MKSLIVLAIAVHLVTVQGSRIIQQDLDYEQLDDYGLDYISADRSDGITAWEDLDEIQGMRMTEDAHPEKRGNPVKCEGSTCKVCYHSFCLGLTHLPEKKQLYLHVDYHEHNLFDKNIDVKDYNMCKGVKILGRTINACLTLSNMRIEADIFRGRWVSFQNTAGLQIYICSPEVEISRLQARRGIRRINNKTIRKHCRGKFIC